MPDSPNPTRLIVGHVRAGEGDASLRLARFNDAYSRKLGMPVFPGTLNLALEQPFDWADPLLQPAVVWFGREEYGGERDILLLPCRLRNLGDRAAYLWTTTTPRDASDLCVIEIIASVGLRQCYALRDGDEVLVEVAT